MKPEEHKQRENLTEAKATKQDYLQALWKNVLSSTFYSVRI